MSHKFAEWGGERRGEQGRHQENSVKRKKSLEKKKIETFCTQRLLIYGRFDNLPYCFEVIRNVDTL